MSDDFDSKLDTLPQDIFKNKSSLNIDNSSESEEELGSDTIRLEMKDYIAITIAAIQTVLAPFFLFIVAIFIILFFLNIVG